MLTLPSSSVIAKVSCSSKGKEILFLRSMDTAPVKPPPGAEDSKWEQTCGLRFRANGFGAFKSTSRTEATLVNGPKKAIHAVV